MLICQCNLITDREIETVVRDLLEEDEWRFIAPVQVYHAMEKRGRCCGCFPGVVDIIVRVTEAWHREKARPDAEVISLVERLRDEHARQEQERRRMRERSIRRTAAA
ncbi:MAG: (2Fe-2S)-binding protein [Notoacmeibacter sp.]|nr:(2Fe-2S)-binding protein [Notoacmeibacter sp.]